MNALIIEDEPRAQRMLRNLLATYFPEISVMACTASVKESVEWLRMHDGATPDTLAPDVIFMDVELLDGTSFQIFDKVKVTSHVIMTTAYDNYAVKAFEVNSLDYLLKPIEPDALKRAVARAEASLAEIPQPERRTPREKFVIRLNDRIVPVKTKDIAYIYSEAKNTYLVTDEGIPYVVDETLDAIEQELPQESFFRISRSSIIAEDAVDSITKLVGGRLRVLLKGKIPSDIDLTVSRSRTDAFLEWLER